MLLAPLQGLNANYDIGSGSRPILLDDALTGLRQHAQPLRGEMLGSTSANRRRVLSIAGAHRRERSESLW